jgi:hypothetical protein
MITDQNEIPFTPDNLRYFDPAIVYEFEPEVGHKPETRDRKSVHSLLHEAGQIHDIYEAYAFMDSLVPPVISRND